MKSCKISIPGPWTGSTTIETSVLKATEAHFLLSFLEAAEETVYRIYSNRRACSIAQGLMERLDGTIHAHAFQLDWIRYFRVYDCVACFGPVILSLDTIAHSPRWPPKVLSSGENDVNRSESGCIWWMSSWDADSETCDTQSWLGTTRSKERGDENRSFAASMLCSSHLKGLHNLRARLSSAVSVSHWRRGPQNACRCGLAEQ